MANRIKSTLVQTTAPANDIMSLVEARAQLRVIPYGSPLAHDDDGLIQRMIDTVTNELDGIDGWLGRALITQEFEYSLDRFPKGDKRIHLPLTSRKTADSASPIVSFTYNDVNGDTQTLVEDTDFIVNLKGDLQYVEPVYGTYWPSVRVGTEAVTIKYNAGYGDTSADIPEVIRNYAFYRLGQLYEFRELFIAGTIIAEVPYIKDSLENIRSRETY